MIVDGAILDADGSRPGYVRLRHGRIVEVGQRGTASDHGRERRLRGIVVPAPVNGHTHLADSVSVREPPAVSLAELVRPPDGYKFTLLRRTSDGEKRRAMTRALRGMRREGVEATIDFREEGLPGVRLLRGAARAAGVRAVVLGRPLRRPIDRAELDALLAESDGVGLSSAREESAETRAAVARACRAKRKLYALHASEERRESPRDYLSPRPDLVVHLSCASEGDLEQVRDDGVVVAVCPRSNALFGRRPDLATMERLGVRLVLGTDNGMLRPPTVWQELEFAYLASRLARRPVSASYLARAAFVEPWRLLGTPSEARIEVGGSTHPLALRLPPDDPPYQLVSRGSGAAVIRTGSWVAGRDGR